jgi:hypothetical protein
VFEHIPPEKVTTADVLESRVRQQLSAITRATHTRERADRRMRCVVIFANTDSHSRPRQALGAEQQHSQFLSPADSSRWALAWRSLDAGLPARDAGGVSPHGRFP